METEAVKLGSGGAVAIPEKFRQALGVGAR